MEGSLRSTFVIVTALHLNLNFRPDLVPDLSVILKLTSLSSSHVRRGRKAEE